MNEPTTCLRRIRIRLWAALCEAILDDRPVTLLERKGQLPLI